MKKIFLIFTFIASIFSSWSMDDTSKFHENGILWKVRSGHKDCLKDFGDNSHTVGITKCIDNEKSILWRLRPYDYGRVYRFENSHTGNCLKIFDNKDIKMNECSTFNSVMWILEKSGEQYKIKNSHTKDCLGIKENVAINDTSCGNNFFWNLDKDYTEICNNIHNKTIDLHIYQSNFTSSFFSGAFYSFFPELCRSYSEHKEYSKNVKVLAPIAIQGLIIFCGTNNYIPAITGIAVSIVLKYLDFTPENSITSGSIVSVISSMYCNTYSYDISSIIGYPISIFGSYAGSTLALKAKSLICERLGWSGKEKKKVDAEEKKR